MAREGLGEIFTRTFGDFRLWVIPKMKIQEETTELLQKV